MSTLKELTERDAAFKDIVEKMRSTIKPHANGIPLSDYKIMKIYKVLNKGLEERYKYMQELIRMEMSAGKADELELYHGSPHASKIASEGFDSAFCGSRNMFGQGIYFAPFSSKSNQYAWGNNNGCPKHRRRDCTVCTRELLICRCFMGNQFKPTAPTLVIPNGYHSIVAEPGNVPTLRYPEYAVVNGDQALPLYLVRYTIVP